MQTVKKGKIVNLKFTGEQYIALQEFYSRTQLSGKEVPAYVEILNILNKGGTEQNGE